MRKLFTVCGLSLLLFTQTGLATAESSKSCSRHKFNNLNLITFSAQSEQWVVADKALVTVGVDANLDQANLASLQNTVLNKLKTLGKDAEWRITQNVRNQDSSGLESVRIEAQARVVEGQLANLRTQSKALSKPGFKFSVVDIKFQPTTAEIQSTQSAVRDDIYKKIGAEITRLNQLYTNQTYFVNRITFIDGDIEPRQLAMLQSAPMPRAAMGKAGYSSNAGGNLGVSKQIKVTALVTLGAKQ